METIDLNSWKEFEDYVERLMSEHTERKSKSGVYVSDYLFRGQSDKSWGLKTTLERYAGRLLGLEEYYYIVFATKPQVETFTDAKWDIPSVSDYKKAIKDPHFILNDNNFPAYEYFVYLRHFGFPSPLLDWSASPFVAAYFAFKDVCSLAPYVSIYAYREWTSGGKTNQNGKPEINGLGPYVRSHKRHFHQQSQYTICTIENEEGFSYGNHEEVFTNNTEDQDELWKFNLPSTEREKALSRLEQFNINAFSLFGSEESLLETLALREIYRGN